MAVVESHQISGVIKQLNISIGTFITDRDSGLKMAIT
jgi:hypothetical protein